MMKKNKLDIFFITMRLLFLFSSFSFFILVIYFIIQRKNAYKPYKINLENVELYLDKTNYFTNDSLTLFLHADEKAKISIYKLHENIQKLEYEILVNKNIQENIYSPIYGLMWKPSLKIPLTDFESGYYYVKVELESKLKSQITPFIVSSKEIPDLVVFANTNTWQAYNLFGGKSYYYDKQTPMWIQYIYKLFPTTKPRCYLPYSRPYSFAYNELINEINSEEKIDFGGSGLAIPFYKMKKGFEKPIYDTAHVGSHLIRAEWNLIGFLEQNEYKYGVFSDNLLAVEPLLMNAKVWIFHVHSEYWSDEMIGSLKMFIANGGKVIFLSGNNIYRGIKFYEWGIEVVSDKLNECEIRNIIGTFYDEVTYPLIAPYQIKNSNHWVFNGLEIEKNQFFGKPGASGFETDRIGTCSEEFEILSVGSNMVGPAQMVIKEKENGAWVFNASSIMITKFLASDSIVNKITKNLINNGLQN